MKTRLSRLAVLVSAMVMLLTACGSGSGAQPVGDGGKPISIGVVGAAQEQWTVFKQKAEQRKEQVAFHGSDCSALESLRQANSRVGQAFLPAILLLIADQNVCPALNFSRPSAT